MSKVTMALSAYDELKRQVEDYRTLAKDWERKAKENEKSLNILVHTEGKDTNLTKLFPQLDFPSWYRIVKVVPNRPLKEMMATLKEVEITNLKDQVKVLTIENEGLTKVLAETVREKQDWETKYKGDALNTAAREAYQRLNEIKGRLDLLRHQLSTFRKNTWMRRKVRNKIESAESYLHSLLK